MSLSPRANARSRSRECNLHASVPIRKDLGSVSPLHKIEP
jgi:hypothetical protein